MWRFVFLVALWSGTVYATHSRLSLPIGFGPCPTPTVADDFVVSLYGGTWYEYERFPTPFEFLVKCGQASYTLFNDTAIVVNNTGIRELSLAGRPIYRKRTQAVGVATIPDPSVPAKLVVRFDDTPISKFAKGNYWVLATDYNTYSLVYSCSTFAFNRMRYEIVWILTRERGVAPSNLDFLKEFLRDSGVDPDNLFRVSQEDCSYDDDHTTDSESPLFFQTDARPNTNTRTSRRERFRTGP